MQWKSQISLQWLGLTAATALIGFAAVAAPPIKNGAAAAAAKARKLRYNQDVRPILSENCFACHGPDSASRKAGLRLDRPADAFQIRDGGRAAILPGDPVNSEIIRRVLKPDADPLRMPPSAGHKSLSAEQKRILIRWIEEGAQYEAHWAYQPPKRSPLPPVKNAAWVRNPIDRFILARMEAAGLTPAPEADRRTLIRRLSLDLTGLPPEPADVERFVNDKSPNAYEKLVDKYLASPQWGEHRGRYWLDAARYADTNGIHFDNYREMWSYRDWVIDAFNRNLPFDQFTIEQIAGDLLPNPTLETQIATGFNRCNITTNEGGSIPEEVAVMYTRDRTETTSQVFLGTTAGCAVCHDHKFDPLTQKEFYSLAAFFNNTTQAPMDGNVKDTAPVVMVPLAQDRPRFDQLKTEIANAKAAVEARKTAARPDFDAWLAQANPASAIGASIPSDGLHLQLPLADNARSIAGTLDGKPIALTATADPDWVAGRVAEKAFQRGANNGTVVIPQAGDFENGQKFSYAAWVKLMPNSTGAIFSRMDDEHDYRGWDLWTEGNRVGSHIISKWQDDALKVVSREAIPANEWHHVCVTYDGGKMASAVRVYIDGVAKETEVTANSLKGSLKTTVPFKIGQRNMASVLGGVGVQDIRLYAKALTPDEVTRLARGTRAAFLASRSGSTITPAEKDELFAWWLSGNDADYKAKAAQVAALEAEEIAIRQRGTVAHVAQEKPEAAMAFVLNRGEYDQRRDKVAPATPAMLPPMPASFPKNRLGFAKWLLLPSHPLTARVTVNRFWQEIFGQGLVRTAGDFGVTGELPSHPELLDWLAVDFRENKWNIKRFFKQMVMSATYRQSSRVTPEKRAKDPQNRLLARGPRFRMDGEMVRDYALASSGLLVRKIGGPSVKPYQPDGVWEAVAMIGSNTRDYKRDAGENLYRRSMYTFWKRAAPPASLDIFNAPSRETCTVRRERTNTPLQALVTMNDIQYVEAARVLAQTALKKGGPTPAARVDFIARRLLARPLRPEEQTIVLKSVADLETYYKSNQTDAIELNKVGEAKPDGTLPPYETAAWTMVVNQLMNLDEVLSK